jgi:hypothetical protein
MPFFAWLALSLPIAPNSRTRSKCGVGDLQIIPGDVEAV